MPKRTIRKNHKRKNKRTKTIRAKQRRITPTRVIYRAGNKDICNSIISIINNNNYNKEIITENENVKTYKISVNNKNYILKKNNLFHSYDNSFYEYYVGKNFISNYVNKYPNFMVMSCLLLYKKSEQKYTNIDYDDKFYSIDENEQILKFSCKLNKNIFDVYTVSEFIEGNSFKDHLTSLNPKNGSLENLIQKINSYIVILYQIYFVLRQLNTKYTHYDLHTGNVLLCPNNKVKYFSFPDRDPNGDKIQPLILRSNYTAKIIDFGRNYFNNDKFDNSKVFLDKICELCDKCGIDNGYGILQHGNYRNYDNHTLKNELYCEKDTAYDIRFITPSKPNLSADLILLNYFVEECDKHLKKYDTSIFKLYGFRVDYLSQYSTPENLNAGLEISQKIITNVMDAEKILKLIIKEQKLNIIPSSQIPKDQVFEYTYVKS